MLFINDSSVVPKSGDDPHAIASHAQAEAFHGIDQHSPRAVVVVQVSILGTFQVRRDGRLLVPSAPKLRQVLALLAINANAVVSTDQIIEELWEDRPPSSATTTLQTYIYHLRKLYDLGFGTRGPAEPRSGPVTPALYRSPNGYVLQLADDAVDSARFLHLAERARAQLEEGSPEPAADTMRAALHLWRGPALVDVTAGPLLRAMTVWLEERRRGLTLQRIDADLQLRRHHEVIGELTGMVAQRPTDESLQSRLMLALYRAGRRFDALQVYQDARSALAEELGLEPLPELQRVHQAVLGADPTMEPPGLAQAGSGTEVPARVSESYQPNQLPPDVVRLVGRQKELTALSQALVRPDRGCAAVAVVVGPPGSGKSTLCVNFAHRVRQDYPDGQFYARLTDDADEPVDPAEVLAGFLRAAGCVTGPLPQSAEELSSLFRSWSARRKVLVVLDDAVSTEQVQPLLPTGAGCATVIAARRRFSHPAVAATVPLEAFDRGDALHLLTHILGEQRVSTQLSAVDELIELCEGLPSALRESAAQLELKPHWPVRKYVDRLRGAAVPEPHGGGRIGTSRSVGRTYRLLPEDLQAAFRTLVRAERPLSVGAAASLLQADGDRAETLVEELVQFGLVEVAYVEGRDDFQYRVRRPFRAFLDGADRTARDDAALCSPARAA